MHRILNNVAVVLIVVTLAACSSGIDGIGQRITFDSSGMEVHASGHPDARVSRDGDLSIAGKPVVVTPVQRQLLQHYYLQARAMIESGKTVSKAGAALGGHVVGNLIRSIFHANSDTAEKQIEAQSKEIQDAAGALCTNVQALVTTQTSLAEQIPSFKPYARANQMQCRITHTVTVNDMITTSTTAADSHATADPSKP